MDFPGTSFKTKETVVLETPASLATSAAVGPFSLDLAKVHSCGEALVRRFYWLLLFVDVINTC
jgi:hypothetical protein